MKLEIEVTDCRDCPMRKEYHEQGGHWSGCTHKDHKQEGYGNTLYVDEFYSTPVWCPLKETNRGV